MVGGAEHGDLFRIGDVEHRQVDKYLVKAGYT